MEKGIKSLIGTVTKRHWFESFLEEAFIKEERTPKAIEEFYVSWAGRCPKVVQLQRSGIFVYKPTEFRNRKAFEYGDAAHARYQKAMKTVGRDAGTELSIRKVVEGLKLVGRLDLIVRGPDDLPYIFEFKTLNGTEFKDLKEPHYDHKCQWTLYSGLFNIPRGFIVYENKDDKFATGILPPLRLFEMKFDKALFDKIIGEFKMIKESTDKNELLGRPAECRNPQYCELKDKCK